MGKRGPKPRDPLERFLGLVGVDPATGCWMWQGHCNNGGYGLFYLAPGKIVLAHRWAYLHWRGEIPAGLDLDHLCRQRPCANPYDLEAVTRSTNLLRGERTARATTPLAERERQRAQYATRRKGAT